jgi:hypothetical protein
VRGPDGVCHELGPGSADDPLARCPQFWVPGRGERAPAHVGVLVQRGRMHALPTGTCSGRNMRNSTCSRRAGNVEM